MVLQADPGGFGRGHSFKISSTWASELLIIIYRLPITIWRWQSHQRCWSHRRSGSDRKKSHRTAVVAFQVLILILLLPGFECEDRSTENRREENSPQSGWNHLELNRLSFHSGYPQCQPGHLEPPHRNKDHSISPWSNAAHRRTLSESLHRPTMKWWSRHYKPSQSNCHTISTQREADQAFHTEVVSSSVNGSADCILTLRFYKMTHWSKEWNWSMVFRCTQHKVHFIVR